MRKNGERCGEAEDGLRNLAGGHTNLAFWRHVATSSGKQDEVVGWEELALFSHVSCGTVSIVVGAIDGDRRSYAGIRKWDYPSRLSDCCQLIRQINRCMFEPLTFVPQGRPLEHTVIVTV